MPIGKKRPHYEEASSPQRQKTASVASLPRPCLVVIGISSLIELKNLFSTPAAPGRYPIPRDRATTHTAAPAISGDRTGVTAKLGEGRYFEVALPETANNHYIFCWLNGRVLDPRQTERELNLRLCVFDFFSDVVLLCCYCTYMVGSWIVD